VLLEDPAVAAGLVAAMGDFNLGEPDDYRVPDGGLFRPSPDEVYCPTAALVVEILSPGDETWDKLPFYAAHEVDELLVVDPEEHVVHWMALKSGEYVDVESSDLIALGPAELADQIDWP
jgi:Uma2 family endonuclease